MVGSFIYKNKMINNKILLTTAVLVSALGTPIMAYTQECSSYVDTKTLPYDKDLWKGLIAECIGEPNREELMLYVACVVRNRLRKGMTHGLVGLKRKDLDEFVRQNVAYIRTKGGGDYEQKVKNIVEQVFQNERTDVTNGATHYENVSRYGLPYWSKNMKEVCKLKGHVFWK